MPATPTAERPACFTGLVTLLRTRFDIWETWTERIAAHLDANREYGPELCTLLLLVLPVPKRSEPVTDKPVMTEAECEAAVRWMELAEKSGEPELFGPLRRGVPANEAGAHLWLTLEAARRVNGNAGAAMVLLRLLTQPTLFPYAGVPLPPVAEDYRMEQAIAPLMENPELFARMTLAVSRHFHTASEIGPLLAKLCAEADEREREALLTLAYSIGMYYVVNSRPSAASVNFMDREALLAAIGADPVSPDDAALELDVTDKTKLN